MRHNSDRLNDDKNTSCGSGVSGWLCRTDNAFLPRFLQGIPFCWLIFLVMLLMLAVSAYAAEKPRVVFLGNSLTAGYQIDENDAFPALIRQKIDERGWNYRVVNAGVSGDTSAGGLSRIDWLLNQPVSVMVISLGANDGLRGLDLDQTKENLQKIIDAVEDKRPDARIILSGMEIPPNLGSEYAEQFRQIYPRLAENNEVKLIPFLLEGVAGEEAYNLDDGIHPNPEGHTIIAETVWEVLEPVLSKAGYPLMHQGPFPSGHVRTNQKSDLVNLISLIRLTWFRCPR